SLFGVASEIGARHMEGLALALMFVSRIGAGIAGATISTAAAVIADSTPPKERARGMALIGMAFGIGFTSGPLCGFASLFVDAPGAPGFAAAILSLIAFILGYKLLPETLPKLRTGAEALGPPVEEDLASPELRRRIFDGRALMNALRTPVVGTV